MDITTSKKYIYVNLYDGQTIRVTLTSIFVIPAHTIYGEQKELNKIILSKEDIEKIPLLRFGLYFYTEENEYEDFIKVGHSAYLVNANLRKAALGLRLAAKKAYDQIVKKEIIPTLTPQECIKNYRATLERIKLIADKN